jgi:hypothetical protein
MGWIHILGFWFMTLCSLTGKWQCFGETHNYHLILNLPSVEWNRIRSLPHNNRLHLLPRRWRYYILLKYWYPPTRLNSITKWKTTILMLTSNRLDDWRSIPKSSKDVFLCQHALTTPSTLQWVLEAHSLRICGQRMKMIIPSGVNFNYLLYVLQVTCLCTGNISLLLVS